MTARKRYYIHPQLDCLKPAKILENFGGVGIDWVEFDDGVRAPMLSLRLAEEIDRKKLRDEK